MKVYRPSVSHSDIYCFHPGADPVLKYTHDVDIVRFKGRFIAGWNANERPGEDNPGQFNYFATSDDFRAWSAPVRAFMSEAGAQCPVDSDNQWQPIFINYHDETLFCAWCDYNARRTFVSISSDGVHWRNTEVANAPPSLAGGVVGFPTNHGLLTGRDVMIFPCSLPPVEPKCQPGHTRYAALLLSDDEGNTWTWSEPIEALSWSETGEDPEEFGGETVYLWEPMVFERPDGSLGLLIRNSTAQHAPERPEKPHRMLLYSESSDHGRTWSRARTVELDTICSRNFAVSGAGGGLLMVMNDHHAQVPQRIPHDRYSLALYCAPVCDPDLLLPGPLVQPAGGRAYYPNGFVEDRRMYLGFSYPRGLAASIVDPLPDFSSPFLLPRDGREGLEFADGDAILGQRQSSLGLVLTEELTRQRDLRLEFDLRVGHYDGQPRTVLTLGGKTRNGAIIEAAWSEGASADVLRVRVGDEAVDLGPLGTGSWTRMALRIGDDGFSATVDAAEPRNFDVSLLRKICFGGLYEPPAWPRGMTRRHDVRVRLDSIVVA